MTEAESRRRRGRRSGGEDTRAALLASAREVFAEQGYQGATVRGIAARAGVDAAMVNHWFGGKQGLFVAAINAPAEVPHIIDQILEGDPDTAGERLVRSFLTVWDAQDSAFAAVVRSASSQETAAELLRGFLTKMVFGRVVSRLTTDRPELRASLCSTQMIGLGMMRYVLRMPMIESADMETLVTAIAPNLQRYLTGDIGPISPR